MDELLKKLLDQEILTEDTKKELENAIKSKINEAVKVAKQDAAARVTAVLNEKFINERESLIEALDAKVSDVLTDELKELREDIERFRDLEAEYATKLVETKQQMAKQVKSEMGDLVEKLDSFLEIRLSGELEELREDIESEKKKRFGQKMFEAFVQEYKKNFREENSVESKLNEAETRLQDTLEQLEKSEKKIAKMVREQKMNQVLAPLSGRTREIMEAVLKSVDTPLLEDAYKTFIGRVLKESNDQDKTSEKESSVLAEDTKGLKSQKKVVKTGDDLEQLKESQNLESKTTNGKEWARKIAGLY